MYIIAITSLFNKLPWPGVSKGTFQSSNEAATRPPVYHICLKLHTVFLLLKVEQGNCEYQLCNLWFDLTGNWTWVFRLSSRCSIYLTTDQSNKCKLYSRPAQLFYRYWPQLREKSYSGPHAFLPRVFTEKSRLFLPAVMAKTNFRPFYLPENGKPFHEEINHVKRPCGPHKIASRAKCGSRAMGWAALLYSTLYCCIEIKMICSFLVFICKIW